MNSGANKGWEFLTEFRSTQLGLRPPPKTHNAMELVLNRSYHRLFYHMIWSTKNREPLITPDVEKWLYPFLIRKVQQLQGNLLALNGIEDHIHLLIQLAPKHQPSKFVKDLKGSSSHYLSQELGLGIDFKWQVGYGIFSVSSKELPFIEAYIRNQKEHHRVGNTIDALEVCSVPVGPPNEFGG